MQRPLDLADTPGGQWSVDPPRRGGETGGTAMNRRVRMGIGLVALIPVIGIAGGLFLAFGVEGEPGAWGAFGVGAVWIAVMTWWALRAPAQLRDDDQRRYLAPLRHAQFRPLDDRDHEETRR